MSTPAQIAANRRNAMKSTGPRSVEGKAASRLNALKSGIDAQSAVIRGEDPAVLEDLALDYHHRFRPATPEQSFLVDTLVHSEWLLRRLRKVEAQLWESELLDAERWDRFRKKCPLGDAFFHALNAFTRVKRRIDSAERSYHRALEKLQRLQTVAPAGEPPLTPGPPPQLEPLPDAPAAVQIGFVPHSEPNCAVQSRRPAAALLTALSPTGSYARLRSSKSVLSETLRCTLDTRSC